MNIPAIAKKTFDQFANDPELSQISTLIKSALNKIKNNLEKARFLHHAVDQFNAEAFSHPLVKQFSPCKSGCSGCCHTQVSATQEEAELLLYRIDQGIKINIDALAKQASKGNKGRHFYELSYKERACVFLDEKGSCRVYADRPMVCRTNAVLGDSAQCDTSDGTQKAVRLIKTTKSDMVIVAAYQTTLKAGTLPHLLATIAQEKKHPLAEKLAGKLKTVSKDSQL